MTWLAPGYLLAGLAAALAVVALHLLAWRRPPALLLPTARFVPDAPARARARAARPTDRALLALRVAALLLVAAALARPARTARRAALARVVIADLSGSVADAAAARAATRTAWRPGDAIVLLDSTVRMVRTPDSLPAASRRATGRGRLSPLLLGADDAARALAPSADSVELVLVSPLLREELDAASVRLAADWPGRARLVRTAPAARDSATRAPVVLSLGDDAVAAGVRAAALASSAEVRLVRRAALADDSAWVRAAAGRVLVSWPVREAPADVRDAALAWADDATIGPYAAADAPAAGHVVLRWADGRPAATERAAGDACVRDVGVALPRAGDVTLSPAFARLLAHLLAPCGGPRDLARVEPGELGLRSSGAARALARPVPSDPWRVGRLLLGAAIVLLLAEPLLRRGDVVAPGAADGASHRGARAEAA